MNPSSKPRISYSSSPWTGWWVWSDLQKRSGPHTIPVCKSPDWSYTLHAVVVPALALCAICQLQTSMPCRTDPDHTQGQLRVTAAFGMQSQSGVPTAHNSLAFYPGSRMQGQPVGLVWPGLALDPAHRPGWAPRLTLLPHVPYAVLTLDWLHVQYTGLGQGPEPVHITV